MSLADCLVSSRSRSDWREGRRLRFGRLRFGLLGTASLLLLHFLWDVPALPLAIHKMFVDLMGVMQSCSDCIRNASLFYIKMKIDVTTSLVAMPSFPVDSAFTDIAGKGRTTKNCGRCRKASPFSMSKIGILLIWNQYFHIWWTLKSLDIIQIENKFFLQYHF